MVPEIVYECHNEIGEAATWLKRSQVLLWVDIDGCILYEYDPLKYSVSLHQLPSKVSTIIPTNNLDVVILALKDRLVSYNLITRELVSLLELGNDMRYFRTNDGKASPEGRIWLGIMHLSDHYQTGGLYCIDFDLSIRKVLDKQCIPNGIVWNSDGTKMYYADSGRACIEEYNYNIQTGEIQFNKILVQVEPSMGVPDGMTIDSEGMLWVAHWGGFGVYIWNPETSKLINKIELPVPNVASCTFGGKNENQLYITTACSGLTNDERLKYPQSGSLFIVNTSKKAGENHYPFILNNEPNT